jgi:hypothetical protein
VEYAVSARIVQSHHLDLLDDPNRGVQA